MSLIVTWSPSYAIFGNPFEMGSFEIDVDRFARMIRGELVPGPKKLITRPKVSDVLRLVKQGHDVVVDIETAAQTPERSWTGKDPMRARLKTVGFGCHTWGLSHWWGSDPKVERVMKMVLEDKSVTKVFQNGYWFDIPVLNRYKIKVR